MIASGLRIRHGTFLLDVREFSADVRGTAVLGPNGAGKSTLLSALAGVSEYDGRIERPARCVMVFARPAVLRGSVEWNIATIVRCVLGCNAADAIRRARGALDAVGLGAMVAADARTLSTGERQRLALARALACEPGAILLDEPFANVDPDDRPALRALVAGYCERTGCELVVATSSLADVFALSARVIVLAAGRIEHRQPAVSLASSENRFVRALVAEAGITVSPPSAG